jgi:cytoplasmic iron level regulating protein YaaA (DUF328/UPF0246 family)
VTVVSGAKFADSGLTRATLRGGRYVGVHAIGDLASCVRTAVADGGFCYGYHADLDMLGHLYGPGSEAWRMQLRQVDRLVESVVDGLPPGGLLAVVADHGMVGVGPSDTVDVDAHPVLLAGVQAIGGEARARHVYVEDGAARDVLAAWRETLADRAWVVSRDEAIGAGWFGARVTDGVRPRIGDVVAAAPARRDGAPDRRAARVGARRPPWVADHRRAARPAAACVRLSTPRLTSTPVIVLLPPSETKRVGGDGPPLRIAELGSPELGTMRATLVDELIALAADRPACRRALGISASQDAEIDRNAALLRAPTLPAINRYTGVLYDALDIESLRGATASRARARLAIGSALFGLLRADDAVPAYRLSAGSKLPGQPTLAARWRPVLEPVLAGLARDELVVDLRSGSYAALGRLPGAVEVDVVSERADGHRLWSVTSTRPTRQLARALAGSRSEPTDAAGVAAVARRAGMRVERRGNELTVVVPLNPLTRLRSHQMRAVSTALRIEPTVRPRGPRSSCGTSSRGHHGVITGSRTARSSCRRDRR